MEWKNIVDRQAKTGVFFTEESRFLSTSQVILSIGAVPYPMEQPPTQSTRLKNGFIHNLFTDKVKYNWRYT